MNDDFYIGYLPKASPSLARPVGRFAAGIVVMALAVGAWLAADQPKFAAGRFEYGVERRFSGVIETWPYPVLVAGNSRVLLVAPGKHGVSGLDRFDGKSVTVRGSLIERGPDRMVELVPASVQQAPGRASGKMAAVDLGRVKLQGEIVDSKCYLGVMNPGERKVHRDCGSLHQRWHSAGVYRARQLGCREVPSPDRSRRAGNQPGGFAVRRRAAGDFG